MKARDLEKAEIRKRRKPEPVFNAHLRDVRTRKLVRLGVAEARVELDLLTETLDELFTDGARVNEGQILNRINSFADVAGRFQRAAADHFKGD